MSGAPGPDLFGRRVAVECFMLADAATQRADNRLDVHGGGVDFLVAPAFPATVSLTLVFKLRAPYTY